MAHLALPCGRALTPRRLVVAGLACDGGCPIRAHLGGLPPLPHKQCRSGLFSRASGGQRGGEALKQGGKGRVPPIPTRILLFLGACRGGCTSLCPDSTLWPVKEDGIGSLPLALGTRAVGCPSGWRQPQGGASYRVGHLPGRSHFIPGAGQHGRGSPSRRARRDSEPPRGPAPCLSLFVLLAVLYPRNAPQGPFSLSTSLNAEMALAGQRPQGNPDSLPKGKPRRPRGTGSAAGPHPGTKLLG